ncbi:MAG: GHMP family kinase ATP-binding protein [Bdellovibrionales bacterium]
MKWIKQSSTRVDLSGGTLDCWPLYLLGGDCVTINLAISISTHAHLEEREGPGIEVNVRDLKYKNKFKDLKEFLACKDADLRLIQKHVEFWKPAKGFYLETYSESPVGGGLGGSSSLSISIIKAFAAWNDRKLDTYEAVNLAHNVEAKVLRKMTGTQDYFPALVPGLNAIHYTSEGAKIESLKTSADFWDQRLSLVYTGQPHQSGLNNWQVIKASLDGEIGTLRALEDIRLVSWDVYAAIKSFAWEQLPKLFDREFEARVRLSSSFSSPEIDRLRAVALKSGALAVKICGAGGGGCVLVWSEPDRKQKVETGCREQGFEVLGVKAAL